MPIADHLIFCAYGIWLPNNPAGSHSDFIRAWDILRAGPTTKFAAHNNINAEYKEQNLPSTAYPPVTFDGKQARQIARGFLKAISETTYTVHACAIMPDHVHIVVRRHANRPKQIVGHLKARATQALGDDNRHPLLKYRSPDGIIPSPWARKSWDVYLDTECDILQAIKYVKENPEKSNLRPQQWPFITPYP